ncbi:hypothetical protein [Moorena producens]|uniref:hypothetical protein n=1 Tax=Moorena producens TaxID=1155739 RepID=UPI0013143D78|nr:hypothetical protein [Moorena producens]
MGSSSAHWNSRRIYYDDHQILDLALTPCLDAVAHGGNHGSCSWLEVTVRQLSLNQ